MSIRNRRLLYNHPLSTTLTNQNYIHEEIESRLNSGNARYRSVQNRLSSRLLPRNAKIKTYKTVINFSYSFVCVWILIPHTMGVIVIEGV
jgi:hypothetical protein